MIGALFIFLLASAWVVHSTPPPDGCECKDTTEQCVGQSNWGAACDNEAVRARISKMCPYSCGVCDRPAECGPQFCEELECENGGLFNRQTCSCDCNGHDNGNVCQNTCLKVDCENGGVFDEQSCSCICDGNYHGNSCQHTCENEGVFDRQIGSCICDGNYHGEFCQHSCSDACVDRINNRKKNYCPWLKDSGRCHHSWLRNDASYFCPFTCGYCSKPDQCQCEIPKNCQNGGTWKVKGCKCECLTGFYGQLCEDACNCADNPGCDGTVKGCIVPMTNKYPGWTYLTPKASRDCHVSCRYCDKLFPKSCGYPKFNSLEVVEEDLATYGTEEAREKWRLSRVGY